MSAARKKRRQLRLFGTAPYLGDNQDLDLLVRFGDRTHIAECKYVDGEDGSRSISVTADITGKEEHPALVGECVERLSEQHEADQGEPATRLLVAVWQKVLNETWRRALL